MKPLGAENDRIRDGIKRTGRGVKNANGLKNMCWQIRWSVEPLGTHDIIMQNVNTPGDALLLRFDKSGELIPCLDLWSICHLM